MKIYFAGSIRGGRADADLYHRIIEHLKTKGQVLTEHVGDTALSEKGDDGPDDLSIYHRDIAWMLDADVLVAEVTQPSLGVGFELGMAKSLTLPILALYRPAPGRYLSAMVSGCPSITVVEYQTLDQAVHDLDQFLSTL